MMTRRDQRLKRVTAVTLAGALTIVAGLPAHAQDDVATLRKQIEELQQRLDAIEKAQKDQAEAARIQAEAAKAQADAAKAQADAAKADAAKTQTETPKPVNPVVTPPVTAASKLPLTISGLLQVQSLNFFSQSDQSPRAQDTFRLRRAEIAATAGITPRLTGLVRIDPAKGLSQNSAGSVLQASTILQDLQLSYQVRKPAEAQGSKVFVDAGQFKIPVGYESTLVSSADTPFVERALIFTVRDPFRGGYGDIRDTGLQVRGNFKGSFSYRLGIFNGLGDRQNAQALSTTKAYLGLLAYTPSQVPGLTLGLSGGFGNTGSGAPTSAGDFPDRSDRHLFNAFGVYKRGKFTAQGEYLTGKSQQIGVAGANGAFPRADIKGYYGTVGYRFTPKIEGLFRYDTVDTNRNLVGDTNVRDLVWGLNYYLKGNNAKLEVNLIRRNGANDNATVGSATGSGDLRNDRTELRTQLQVAF